MIFTGKRVALIGAAPIQEDYREIIESCDIVIRVNDAFPIRTEVSEKTGTRCDVLYIWRKVKPKPGWYPIKQIRLKPDAIFADDWLKDEHILYRNRLALVDPEHFYGLSEATKTRVNTGMVAISEIAAARPSFFFITGITFYQSPIAYHKGYVSEAQNKKISAKRGNMWSHRQKPQLLYFVRKIWKKKFVQCDAELEAICQRAKIAYLTLDRNIDITS